MKKLAVVAAVIASVLSLDVCAGNTYVGAGLGYQSMWANSIKFTGWRPGIFIGYGGRMDDDSDDYYLALEFASTWVSEIKNDYVNRDQSLRMAPNLSLSLLPGVVMAPYTMLYGRFGLGEAKRSVENDWLRFFSAGVGVEYDLTPCWAMRAEADYSIFRTINPGTPRSADFTLSLKYTYDT